MNIPMGNGPGKYDDVCTMAREAAKAKGVLLMVFDGEHGQGFSAQLPPELVLGIPAVLRQVADQIEKNTCQPWIT